MIKKELENITKKQIKFFLGHAIIYKNIYG